MLIAGTSMLYACQKEQTKETKAEPAAILETLEQKASYIIGYTSMKQMIAEDIGIDESAFILGIKESFADADSKVPEDEIQVVMAEFQQKVQARLQEKQQNLAAENLETNQLYLEENAKKEGVTVTNSGLQYKIIKEGNGAKPEASNKIRVHYEGKLTDGTVFDSSYERGNPAEFNLNQVIAGWTEGLQLMPEGSVWELTIPADLGYGDRGAGNIGPNSVLIFKVELLDSDLSDN